MINSILYIGGFILPNGNAAAQRVVANAKILRELNYEVRLVGLTRDGSGLTPFKYEGFDCVNLPYPKSFLEWLRMLTSIKQYIPFYTDDTSIVIAYNHPAIALKKLLKYNRKRGIKTLSDCTEWYNPEGGRLHSAIKGWDINTRMRKVHPKLDGIISISRYLHDYYTGVEAKSLLLPPLVDKQEKKWNEVLPEGEEKISLIYAGSLLGNKDRLDFVIDALSEVGKERQDFSLEIIGTTEQQYRDIYFKGSPVALPSFVCFRGRLPHEDVVRKLRMADYQILLREDHLANRAGFPTKFVETISAGTIALTNASSNLKEYMKEGENCFELDISSKDALVNSFIRPLSLTKGEIKLQKQTIDTELFDYRRYITRMKDFIESL